MLDYLKRRRGYERINVAFPSGGTRRRNAAEDSGEAICSDRKSLRRFFKYAHCRRVKLTNKLQRLRLEFSPNNFLPGLRDAYVDMMLRFANASVGRLGGGGTVSWFGTRPLDEYDDGLRRLHLNRSTVPYDKNIV